MRRSSLTPKWAYRFFHTENVASLTPSCRHTSGSGVPLSACRNAYVICSSVNFERFMAQPSWQGVDRKPTALSLVLTGLTFQGQRHPPPGFAKVLIEEYHDRDRSQRAIGQM